jgi:dihydroorotase
MNATLIKGATIVSESRQSNSDILINDCYIAEILPAVQSGQLPNNCNIIDARGKILIPGVIDDHVHFREPGLTNKADIFSESRAAVAGGITSFMDMPNTQPQTITQQLLEEKYKTGASRSLINYSFYLGATNDNLNELLKTNPSNVCGIKVFMGASTGNMLVNKPKILEGIFKKAPLPVAVHCEDEETIIKNLEKFKQKYGDNVPVTCHPLIRNEESCYKSSAYAVELASKYGTRLHLLHLSTAREMELLASNIKPSDKKITAEVCIHHLWFSDEDYTRLGNFIKWNPAIKSNADREGLWKGLLEGKIDVVATDHAPHTFEEKQNTYLKCPSGSPLIQHSLVAMLQFYKQGKISLEEIVYKMCHTPADIFKIDRRGYIRKGYFADLVLIDINHKWTVSKNNLLYKCGWSPFEGVEFSSSVTQTFVNGHLVFDNGTIDESNRGMRLHFNRESN